MATVVPFRGNAPTPDRPVLELSGPKLRSALESLVKAAQPVGGIETLAEGLKLKSSVFQRLMADGRAARLELSDFEQLTAAMATVRRRIAGPLGAIGWTRLCATIATLAERAYDTGSPDATLKA